MKRSILLLWVLVLLTFSGCGSAIKGLMLYDKDPALTTLGSVRTLPMMTSVGFEWDTIKDKKIHGINVYRKSPDSKDPEEREFRRIGTIGNRYATHFVDTHVKPDTRYIYKFSTFSMGKESVPGTRVEVQTKPTFAPVSFLQAYKVGPTAIKLLWRPHSSDKISSYVIERSVNGREWKFMAQVEGVLMAEYIDTLVRGGNTYAYRVIAKSYEGVKARPSQVSRISL